MSLLRTSDSFTLPIWNKNFRFLLFVLPFQLTLCSFTNNYHMIHDKNVLIQLPEKKWNILTSMITWLECLQELFPLNLCWINEDINIISFISDIVFENFQMREKMVWYVESPIVLRCTLLALIIYICIMFLLFAKLEVGSNTVQ